MTEFALTMDGIKTIAGWFGSVLNWRLAQNAEKKAAIKTALTSLMAAATETRQYLAIVKRNPTSQNADKENQLASLWTRAGIDMTEVDYDLALRYLKKADYWSDPKGWTDAQKDERLIQLDEVLRLGQEALRRS
jgi:hypothetical protein